MEGDIALVVTPTFGDRIIGGVSGDTALLLVYSAPPREELTGDITFLLPLVFALAKVIIIIKIWLGCVCPKTNIFLSVFF